MYFFFKIILKQRTNVCYNINTERVNKMKGRVKWWSDEKGYGFIEYNKDENIFAHIKEEDKIIYPIRENQEIEFDLEEKENGKFIHILRTLEN